MNQDQTQSQGRLLDLGETLMDSFCEGLDRKALLAAIAQKQGATNTLPALVEVWGISDASVFNRLIKFGVTVETMAAMVLTPLVLIAWADGKIDRKERSALLEAARSSGLEPDSLSYLMLEGRTNTLPQPGLLESWKAYITVLAQALDEVSMISLRGGLMTQAREVAAASGGILGLGDKISDAELTMLAELEKAFP